MNLQFYLSIVSNHYNHHHHHYKHDYYRSDISNIVHHFNVPFLFKNNHKKTTKIKKKKLKLYHCKMTTLIPLYFRFYLVVCTFLCVYSVIFVLIRLSSQISFVKFNQTFQILNISINTYILTYIP